MVDDGWLMLGVVVILVIVVGVLLFMGDPSDKNNIGTTEIIKPYDYGNGVYYFEATRAKFANSLSEFLENKNVTSISVSGDGSGAYGSDMGYYVVVR